MIINDEDVRRDDITANEDYITRFGAHEFISSEMEAIPFHTCLSASGSKSHIALPATNTPIYRVLIFMVSVSKPGMGKEVANSATS